MHITSKMSGNSCLSFMEPYYLSSYQVMRTLRFLGNENITYTSYSFSQVQKLNRSLIFFPYSKPVKLTLAHPYNSRLNQQRFMDRFEENQNLQRQDMESTRDQINQLLETLHVMIKGQEDPLQNVATLIAATNG